MAEEPQSYRINNEPDQIRREHDRLRVLARIADERSRRALPAFHGSGR